MSRPPVTASSSTYEICLMLTRVLGGCEDPDAARAMYQIVRSQSANTTPRPTPRPS